MILDLLPFKKPARPRRRFGFIRYIMFALSFGTAILLIALGKANKTTMFYLFVAGNVVYYVVGIILAVVLKDNRAFCKYICPITVFLKPMSYYSRLRVVCDQEKCIGCNACRRACPMEVDMLDPSRKRTNGTECILCGECERACPQGALRK
jgi:polyferredoxin